MCDPYLLSDSIINILGVKRLLFVQQTGPKLCREMRGVPNEDFFGFSVLDNKLCGRVPHYGVVCVCNEYAPYLDFVLPPPRHRKLGACVFLIANATVCLGIDTP